MMKPRRVLLVEDEMLIAMHMEEMLTELGFEVVGPAMRLKRAVELAQIQEIDLALLDVNLAGKKSFPVAHLLRERNVPFVFATGYGAAGLNDDFLDTPVLQKPVEKHQLAKAISAISEGTAVVEPASEATGSTDEEAGRLWKVIVLP